MVPDEVVLDRVIVALVTHPCTYAELFSLSCGEDDSMPLLGQVDEALDILRACNALDFLKKGHVFVLKSESRTWITCPACKGAGFGERRCPACKGNGLFTPIPEL